MAEDEPTWWRRLAFQGLAYEIPLIFDDVGLQVPPHKTVRSYREAGIQ